MPVRNGIKYACESCVRGHRVSSCTHNERPLKEIAPKGRPQKQCEHCRLGRKTSSQHNKCDCGHRKDKKDHMEKEMEGDYHDVKKDHSDCSCNKPGKECICSRKSKPLADRLHSSLKRPTVPVKSKSSVDNQVPVVSHNGHHKPSHRFNKLGHTAGAPYPARTVSSRSRPHTLHVDPSYTGAALEGTSSRAIRDSQDDMYLAMNNIYGGISKADHKAIIPEEDEDGIEANGTEGIDWDKALLDSHEEQDPLDPHDALKWSDDAGASSSWPSISATRMPFGSPLVISPNFLPTSGINMDWPASPTFSPDLSPVRNDEIAPPLSNNGSSASDTLPSLQGNIISSSSFAPWSQMNVPFRESVLDSWTYDDLSASLATTHYSAADTDDDIGDELAGLKSPMRDFMADSENDAAVTTASSSPPRAVFLQRIVGDDDEEFEEDDDHADEAGNGRYDGQWFIPAMPVSPQSNRLADQYSWLI